MKQHRIQFNSAQQFIDRKTSQPFYFGRIVQQDANGHFISLPSCKVFASTLQGIEPLAKSDAMITFDSYITTDKDGNVVPAKDAAYIQFSNAKLVAYSKPSRPKIDRDALTSLVASDAPFEV